MLAFEPKWGGEQEVFVITGTAVPDYVSAIRQPGNWRWAAAVGSYILSMESPVD